MIGSPTSNARLQRFLEDGHRSDPLFSDKTSFYHTPPSSARLVMGSTKYRGKQSAVASNDSTLLTSLPRPPASRELSGPWSIHRVIPNSGTEDEHALEEENSPAAADARSEPEQEAAASTQRSSQATQRRCNTT